MGVSAGKPVFENATVEEMFSHGTKQRKPSGSRQSPEVDYTTSSGAPEGDNAVRNDRGTGCRCVPGGRHRWIYVAGMAVAALALVGLVRYLLKRISQSR